jgi:hypothetical protein
MGSEINAKMEPTPNNTNYIRVCEQSDGYALLVPKSNIKINEHNLESTILTFFELTTSDISILESEARQFYQINLVKPVILNAENEVVQKGELKLVRK